MVTKKVKRTPGNLLSKETKEDDKGIFNGMDKNEARLKSIESE